MKQRPDPSDEEIIRYMDFDALRKKQVEFDARKKNRYAIFKWSVPVLLIISLGLWYYNFYDSEVEVSVPSQNSELQTGQLPHANTTAPALKDSILIEGTLDQKLTNATQRDVVKPIDSKIKLAEQKDIKVESKPIESIYVQAEPVNGFAALYSFLNTNLQYPIESVKDSIQGVQTISFIINAQGKPEHIEFVESLGVPFEVEARRLIESMPLWKPATLNGKPVASKLVLPITFQIQTLKAKN